MINPVDLLQLAIRADKQDLHTFIEQVGDYLERERPVKTGAIAVDFYRPEMRKGCLLQARWCIARFEWRGSHWARVRRLTGPLTYEVALEKQEFHRRKTGLPLIIEV